MTSKSINTLVKDIYDTVSGKVDINEVACDELAASIAKMLKERLVNGQREPKLSMSNFGTPDRKLWYSINKPEAAEALLPQVRIKFLYGDILELLVLWLAKQAGHDVKGEQTTLNVAGIEGHRDAVIDGLLVDVKSASGFAFNKFKDHKVEQDDPFGYIDQGSLYLEGSQEDVTVKKEFAFLAINKENGSIVLDRYKKRDKDYHKEASRKRGMLAESTPPSRCYPDVPDGQSGNRKLDTVCSYCNFKNECWPELRTFLYSNGPRFLTKVEREPRDVYEKKKDEGESPTVQGYKF